MRTRSLVISQQAPIRRRREWETDTLWAWGNNDSGQLRDDATIDRPSPVQVGTDTHEASITAGGNSAVAIKTDGTLWCGAITGLVSMGMTESGHRQDLVEPPR